MKINHIKIASLLAFIIGAMAIFAGGRTLLGKDPGYYVINWLLLYNYTLGILTVFVTTILIWTGSRYARAAAIGTFTLHVLVMLILLLAYRAVVAPDSLVAMTLRIVIWGIILCLLWIPLKRSSHA